MGVGGLAKWLWSRTVRVHVHSLGFQRSHVYATHVCGPERNRVTHPEAWVIEQRLDVCETRVMAEGEEPQAREPAQWAEVGDGVGVEGERCQAREPAQWAEVGDGVVVEGEDCQARERAQGADVGDGVVVEADVRQAVVSLKLCKRG